MIRRTFIKNTAVTASGLALIPNLNSAERKLKISLSAGAIGVKSDLTQTLEYAIKYGFDAFVPDSVALARMDSGKRTMLLSKMKKNNITFGSAGLPMDFRKESDKHKEGLNLLAEIAPNLQSSGVTRMSTWIMPTHKSLTYIENMKQQSSRLKQIANILGHHGISFGLEYVGPKTLMARDQYPFVSSMKECAELIERINEANVGYVLDSFHWYCAQESAADILTLDSDQIVTVDLNDAIAGRDVYTQLDWERKLPGDSGVIDIDTFINALKTIGYNGPVRAEPFNKVLNEMNDDEALKLTYQAMKRTVED